MDFAIEYLDDLRNVLARMDSGPIEEAILELQAAGDNMMSYLLDSAGVVALGGRGQTLRLEQLEIADNRLHGLALDGWGTAWLHALRSRRRCTTPGRFEATRTGSGPTQHRPWRAACQSRSAPHAAR